MATTDLTETASEPSSPTPSRSAAGAARPHLHGIRRAAGHPDRGGVPVHHPVLLDGRQRAQVEPRADAVPADA